MKYLAAMVIFLLSLAACGQTRSSGEYCDTTAGRSACDGKNVRIISDGPAPMMQHPRISMDKSESYWMVKDSAWILVSDSPIRCEQKLEATGRLKTNVGPCDPSAQNKNMYCGTALYVSSWRCL
ncbi:MAG: hypothetical protein K8S54_12940 [Spirochaetia bacterium]|nr:hypothetical protein [Spirochaetia bacterium]